MHELVSQSQNGKELRFPSEYELSSALKSKVSIESILLSGMDPSPCSDFAIDSQTLTAIGLPSSDRQDDDVRCGGINRER